jgi:hypothetical protein
VWDEGIFQFSVLKDEIDDHWVQDLEDNREEKYDVKKTGDTGNVPHPGDKIHIPLDEKTAIKAFFKVKPTKDMPRSGATKSK